MRPIGGFSYLRSCLIETAEGQVGDFGRAVSGPRNSVSWENRDRLARDRFEVWRLGGGQTEHAVLARPFGGKFAKTRDTHSIGQTPLDGCLDEVGCKEGERERHVDLAHAAALSLSDRFNSDRRFGHKLVQPPSSFGN